MTNYVRYETDAPDYWHLIDMDDPSTSPEVYVCGDDVVADSVADALNARACGSLTAEEIDALDNTDTRKDTAS